MQTRLLARFCLVPWLLWDSGALQKVLAAESAATNYLVSNYVVAGYQVPPTNSSLAMISKYTGRNVGLGDLVKAACALQWDYRSRGYRSRSCRGRSRRSRSQHQFRRRRHRFCGRCRWLWRCRCRGLAMGQRGIVDLENETAVRPGH